MARGGLTHHQLWAANRAVRDGHLNSGRVSKKNIWRGGAAKRSRSNRRLYTSANSGSTESQYFGRIDDWSAECLVPGKKKVIFGLGFPIGNTHVEAIVAAGPAYCHPLRHFESGDAHNGNGAGLSDASIILLAEACPNLTYVSLEASIRLTDSSLLALLTKCHDLQYVEISGNEKVRGTVRGAAIAAMAEDASLGRKIQKFRFTDQDTYNTKCARILESLSAKRKKLAIEVGEVRKRGLGISTWLGGKMRIGYQASGVPGGFSRYGGVRRQQRLGS